MESGDKSLIKVLWQEHLAAPFPEGLRGRDIDGIDFVVLDAEIAGCVDSFLERGKLNTFQLAVLGISYRNAHFVTPTLNGEAAAYFWRLERMAGLVLRKIARDSQS